MCVWCRNKQKQFCHVSFEDSNIFSTFAPLGSARTPLPSNFHDLKLFSTLAQRAWEPQSTEVSIRAHVVELTFVSYYFHDSML